jgi:hypothetical protein
LTEDLYNALDKKRVRELLTLEQSNLCAITLLPIEPKQHILEHSHDDQMFIRGVTSRQANSALGVIEKMWTRYMKWWYNGTLSNFLRQCADYLEKEHDSRWRHDMWIKKINTEFNKLKESQKDNLLVALNQSRGKNGAERKKLFQKAVLTKQFSYDTIRTLIQEIKDSHEDQNN